VSFGGPTSFAAGQNPSSVAVGDLDADSHADLAVANLRSSNDSVLLAEAGGNFSFPINFRAGHGPQSVAVGDFNGDSRPDLRLDAAAGGRLRSPGWSRRSSGPAEARPRRGAASHLQG
jgi:FG-GAP-like repeat